MTDRGPAVALWPNLGAEENKDTDRGHQLPRSTAIVQQVARLWALLFAPGARILPAGDTAAWPPSLGARPSGPAFDWLAELGDGVPWLATRSARKELEALGLRYRSSPPEAARAASDKGFALALAREARLNPPELEARLHTLSPADLRTEDAPAHIARLVRALDHAGRDHTLKPRWGLGGRGRVRVAGPDAAASLTPATLERLAVRGGAVLEPWLDRIEDFSAQLFVGHDGAVVTLGTSRQVLSRAGVYMGNRGSGAVAPRAGTRHDDAVAEAGRLAATAAARLGFVGPCGTDAFSYRGPAGREELRPLVEFNARFTIGTIAFGLVRRALAAGLADPADTWCFLLTAGERIAAPTAVRVLPLADDARPPLLAFARDDATLDRFVAAARA